METLEDDLRGSDLPFHRVCSLGTELSSSGQAPWPPEPSHHPLLNFSNKDLIYFFKNQIKMSEDFFLCLAQITNPHMLLSIVFRSYLVVTRFGNFPVPKSAHSRGKWLMFLEGSIFPTTRHSSRKSLFESLIFPVKVLIYMNWHINVYIHGWPSVCRQCDQVRVISISVISNIDYFLYHEEYSKILSSSHFEIFKNCQL